MTRRCAAITARTSVPAQTMPKRVAPDKCDCLIWCGDDPWIATRQAQPCAAKVKRDSEAAEIQRRFVLQRQLADAATVRLVEFGAPSVWIGARQWFDTAARSATQPAAEVARAVEYLLLRRLLERHSHKPHLVRILPEAPPWP